MLGLLLLLSNPAEAALFFGNPGALSFVFTNDAETVVDASIWFVSAVGVPCDTTFDDVPFGRVEGAVDASVPVVVTVPAGKYCSVEITWAAPSAVEVLLDELVVEELTPSTTTVSVGSTGGTTDIVVSSEITLELVVEPDGI